MDFLARHRIGVIAAAAAVLIVGFLLFRPDKLFVDDRVDESLAQAFDSGSSGEVGAEDGSAVATPTTTTPATTITASGVVDDEGNTAATTAATTAAPQDPVAIATGSFSGIDHAATGTATVYEKDGRFVLRFEDDTDIQNGPDLYVWLLAADDYGGGDPGTHLDLGKIKGNVGGQNYELPEGFDPDVHKTVLVWCLRFGVPFAAAPLSA